MTDKTRTHVATLDDGSQILIDIFPEGTVSVATRPDKWATWSRRTDAEDKTWKD